MDEEQKKQVKIFQLIGIIAFVIGAGLEYGLLYLILLIIDGMYFYNYFYPVSIWITFILGIIVNVIPDYKKKMILSLIVGILAIILPIIFVINNWSEYIFGLFFMIISGILFIKSALNIRKQLK